jgi:hypothetical protein
VEVSGEKHTSNALVIFFFFFFFFFFIFFLFFFVALTEWRFSRPRHFPKTERI